MFSHRGTNPHGARMMKASVCIPARSSWPSGPIGALDEVLDYITAHDDVWIEDARADVAQKHFLLIQVAS